MAIKKRTPVDQARIEAFGAAADAPTENATLAADPPPAVPTTPSKPAVGEWPADVAKTLLIRWPDANLALELAQVSALEDRSQHKTAIRALQRGLDVLRAEHRSE